MKQLSNLIKEREKELNEENNEYKKQIDKLKSQINEYKNLVEKKENEKINIQKRYDCIVEEKKILLDKMIILQEENQLKIETAKNKKLNTKNHLNKYLFEKEEEIKNLNEYIYKIKKEFNKVKEKKNYYKTKCKEFNKEIINEIKK